MKLNYSVQHVFLDTSFRFCFAQKCGCDAFGPLNLVYCLFLWWILCACSDKSPARLQLITFSSFILSKCRDDDWSVNRLLVFGVLNPFFNYVHTNSWENMVDYAQFCFPCLVYRMWSAWFFSQFVSIIKMNSANEIFNRLKRLLSWQKKSKLSSQ